jgi:proteasome assembly chaperone (PAC2) family protein
LRKIARKFLAKKAILLDNKGDRIMEAVKLSKRPKLKKPYLVVAWPGMGEVAFKAVSYLVEQLKAEEFAQITAENFFYSMGSAVQEGILSEPDLPQGKFYFWKNKAAKNDLIIFISNAQPDLARAEEYSQKILQLARAFAVEVIFAFAAIPQAIEHTQQAGVWYTATSLELKNEFKKYNLHLLLAGQISGMNGLFLGIAKREGFKGVCLLGEIPLYTIQIENPKASYAVLVALARILNLSLNFSALLEQVNHMEAEINRLLEYLKSGGTEQAGPIGEEEIEKIKHALSQLSRLPASVKDKIEGLFEQAKQDIAKAASLKAELDKWNAYKEYEDRFLDLFHKSREKGN